MGTLLNALRRMQRQAGTADERPDPTSVILVNPQGRSAQHPSRVVEMQSSGESARSQPNPGHPLRLVRDRQRGPVSSAGLSQGVWDEQIETTLASVDALLAMALSTRPDTTAPPDPLDMPPRALGNGGPFGDRIHEIAADGTISLPSAREVLTHPANWQSTLDALDQELCLLDHPDGAELFGHAEACPESPLSEVGDTDDDNASSQIETRAHQECPPYLRDDATRTACVSCPGGTVLTGVHEDPQFRQALQYAAQVVSDTRHMTVDLLDTTGSQLTERFPAGQLPEAIGESDEDLPRQEDVALEEPLDPHDVCESTVTHDWHGGADDEDHGSLVDGGTVERSSEPDPPPAEAAGPGDRMARPPARTAFEQELAIKMANTRYHQQCHATANRILQDLANRSGGRTVVLVGCDDSQDPSEVVAALGHVFSELFGARILLVDAHLSRQSLSRHYHVSGLPGIAELCTSLDRWNQLVQPTHHDSIGVMPAGCRLDRHVQPEEILGGLLASMRDQYDLIIVDAGEAGSATAAACLAAGDAGYLVVQLGQTGRDQARRAVASVQDRQLKLQGCIVLAPGASPRSQIEVAR